MRSWKFRIDVDCLWTTLNMLNGSLLITMMLMIEREWYVFSKKRRKEIGKKMHDDKRVEVRQPITKNDEPQPNTDGSKEVMKRGEDKTDKK